MLLLAGMGEQADRNVAAGSDIGSRGRTEDRRRSFIVGPDMHAKKEDNLLAPRARRGTQAPVKRFSALSDTQGNLKSEA